MTFQRKTPPIGVTKASNSYSLVTTTSGEGSDEQETPAVSTALADADNRLGDIASAIPPVDPEMMTLKHSAFLAQLLMDEVDVGESTHGGAHDHAVFSMQATDGPTGQVPGAKPSPNNMPVSWYDVHHLQQVPWAKAEGIEREPAWTSSREPGKSLCDPRRMMKR